MSSDRNRQIRLNLDLNVSPSLLFEGIAAWRDLGLLNDPQVKHLCRLYLSDRLPVTQVAKAKTPKPAPKQAVGVDREIPTQKQSPLARISQSLMEELSVRWLLFLGVFMVVASSGVLAASQWERFPASGQYGVMWAYTIVFAIASEWAARKPNLTLTAQTLRIVTLLLMPLNFWAMDSFGLWQTPLGWGTIAVATVSLTGIVWKLCRHRTFLLLPLLLLSYLHWGWGWAAFPLIAVYIGTIATAGNTLITQKRSSLAIADIAITLYTLLILLGRAFFFAAVPLPEMGLAIGICGWLFTWMSPPVAREEETRRQGEMGEDDTETRRHGDTGNREGDDKGENRSPQHKAFRLTASPNSEFRIPNSEFNTLPFWQPFGGFLLFLGWFVSVWDLPALALAVSVLAMLWLFDRLRRVWRKRELAALFLVGWQGLTLIGRVIPSGIRQSAIVIGTEVTQAHDTPGSLLTLTWFPYLIGMLLVNEWIDRNQKPKLVRFGDKLALGFGIFLVCLGFPNPSLRSLNLIASAITLFVITRHRYPTSSFAIHLTHLTGLAAIGSCIFWRFPDISYEAAAAVALVAMLIEWGVAGYSEWRSNCRRQQNPFPQFRGENGRRDRFRQIWRRSSWHFGFVLAGFSYLALYDVRYSIFNDESPWGWMWLLVPTGLTVLSGLQLLTRRKIAGWLSILGVLIAQTLTFSIPTVQLWGLAVGTVLMFFNTRYVWSRWAAAITVGCGVFFVNLSLWEGIPGIPPIRHEKYWLLVWAVSCVSLWGWRSWLQRRDTPTAKLYVPGADGWAIALCVWNLTVLTVLCVFLFFFDDITVQMMGATVLILGGIVYRSWHRPTNATIFGLGWGLELLTIQIVSFYELSTIALAIANIALGLAMQLVGDWWQRKSDRPLPVGWHIVPLLYGIAASVLRVDTATAWTGFLTFGMGLVFIGVGRRQPRLKPIVYLGTLAVSAAAYEILAYRIAPLATGDRLIAIAALATSIAYLYRLLTPMLVPYLTLSPPEIATLAHLHWGLGSISLITATVNPVRINDLLGLGTGFLLTRYGVMQGRDRNNTESKTFHPRELWVYAGILEGAAVILYAGYQLKLGELLLPWLGAIAAIVSYFLYLLPWASWGWHPRPWKNSALLLPVVAAGTTYAIVNPYSLLFIAAFYAILSQLKRQIRLSYYTLFFLSWLLLDLFWQWQLQSGLWYVSPPVLSILFIAQFDPSLQQDNRRDARHLIRVLATVLLGYVALVHSNWLAAGVLSLVLIFGGLILRVRAFLFVGTLLFLLNATNQLILLSQDYSFMKWLIGISIGLVLIWVAASFETRREQIKLLLKNWILALESWE